MYAEVYLRRCRGKRLRPSDENTQPPLYGTLQLAYVGAAGPGYAVLTLRALGNQTEQGELLRLYEPVIIGLGTWWMVFRGFESYSTEDGTVSFVQEWRCHVTERTPRT